MNTINSIFLILMLVSGCAPVFAASPIIGGTEGPTFNAPTIYKEITEPSSPAAGYQKIWMSSVDGRMYRKTSAGVVVEVGPDISGKLDNPMTTNGDMIYQTSGVPARLAIGSVDTVQISSGSAPSWAKILDANIDTSAAIAYSKLDLSNGIVNADVNSSAAIDYSKLNLVGSIVNADVSASAAIDYSKLALTGSIINADINASAGIVDTKLATISTSGKVSNSATTATSLNNVSSIVARDASGNFTAGTVTANLNGNAGTATAFQTNPSDCSSDRYATTIDTSGNLTCAQVTNAGLAGSIAASKLIGTDITTVGTITSGTWQGSVIQPAYGGTGQSTLTGLNIPSLATDILSLSEQSSTPSTPSAGTKKLYAKNDGKVYTLNSAGTETQVGAGAGGGGINFITNPDAESDTSGWAVYADAAAATPVDGTGGSPSVTITRNTSTPLRGTGDFLFAKDASNRQGQGFSYDFSVDGQDSENVSKSVYLTFDYKTGSGFTQGDLLLFIYDKTSGALLSSPPTCNDGTNTLLSTNALPGRMTCTFYTVANHKNYRLIGHIATTGTTAWSLWYDTVKAEPTVGLPGAIVTEWQSYTLAIGATTTAPTPGTVTVNSAKWRRVGDSMEITYQFEQTSAGSAGSGDYLFPIPAGYTIDTSKLTAMNPARTIVGDAKLTATLATAGPTTVSGTVLLGTTNATSFKITYSTGASENTAVVGSSGYGFNNAQISISFFARVPISGWAASNFMSSAALNAQTPAPITATSATKTPAGTGHYHALTGNGLSLTPGIYELSGEIRYENGGSSPAYSAFGGLWAGSNGADSGTLPTSLGSTTGVTLLSAYRTGGSYMPVVSTAAGNFTVPNVTIRVTQTTTVYLVSYSEQTTSSNARITVYANAKKLPDFTVYGAYNNTVSASAYSTATQNAASSGTYFTPTYSNEVVDTTNSFNTSTGQFTAPEDGLYQACGYGTGVHVTAAFALDVGVTVGTQSFVWRDVNSANNLATVGGCLTNRMTTGQTAYMNGACTYTGGTCSTFHNAFGKSLMFSVTKVGN